MLNFKTDMVGFKALNTRHVKLENTLAVYFSLTKNAKY